MSLRLTVDVLRGAYEYLAVTEPFIKWNLPPAEDIIFKVGKTAHTSAWVSKVHRKARFTIGVSQRKTGQTSTLMEHMAHEMIHVHLYQTGMNTSGAEHNGAFEKLAEQVCKVHGFDIKMFY